jgi:hypothetical protein
MQGRGSVIGGQMVCATIEGEAAAGDPIGVAPKEGAERASDM